MNARFVQSTHPNLVGAASFQRVEADRILDGGRGMERVGWVGSITWFRENLRPPSSIYNHALAVGFSRGFVVAAAIALLALLIGIATIRVSRQELARAVPEPQEAAPQPGTLERHEEQAALAATVRPCRLCLSPPRSIPRPFSARIAPRDKLPFPVHSKIILTRDGVVLSFVPSFHFVQPCELL